MRARLCTLSTGLCAVVFQRVETYLERQTKRRRTFIVLSTGQLERVFSSEGLVYRLLDSLDRRRVRVLIKIVVPARGRFIVSCTHVLNERGSTTVFSNGTKSRFHLLG